MTRRARLVLCGAAAYGLALVLIATWPTHVDQDVPVLDSPPGSWLIDLGVPSNVTYQLIESAANVALFVPFGVLAMLASRRVTWVKVAVTGLVVSGAIEILQAVIRPGRTASANDVAANTLGAALGAIGVALWRWARGRR